MAEFVNANEYYQIVLEAREIEHRQPMSLATELHLSDHLPPRSITFNERLFREDKEG
jgi:hypothetical protein